MKTENKTDLHNTENGTLLGSEIQHQCIHIRLTLWRPIDSASSIRYLGFENRRISLASACATTLACRPTKRKVRYLTFDC
ncbi:hypothetical protein ES319_D11G191000v1 [Gossypium barbadense]|uniref:Uncharacterized protein n=2 Tax=Gossypium TaxID=3633 RepID=A0A5J5PE19_GOSBA|nr:hypothetical protein ES319_D11G191000v1 [Gossypium barbadense]TYG45772.1 hypothetical protein ES288_D11G201700v1 [Gossypium darwinii]